MVNLKNKLDDPTFKLPPLGGSKKMPWAISTQVLFLGSFNPSSVGKRDLSYVNVQSVVDRSKKDGASIARTCEHILKRITDPFSRKSRNW